MIIRSLCFNAIETGLPTLWYSDDIPRGTAGLSQIFTFAAIF
ncbi:hypothetical protein ENTCAN_09565 [Enterobacter cancerogenus ATCC 35316]|nr:hypothetical protein ENTCAN_09565 [Enterobacter cancerogenus ATCC 35316]